MGWSGKRAILGVALTTAIGAGTAALLAGYLHGLTPVQYQSVAMLYMPADTASELSLASPPDSDLPPIERYTGAALATLRMPDYATLSRSETVAERVAARLWAVTELTPNSLSFLEVQRAMHAEARQHWSGVYQVIYQRSLPLRVRWPDPELSMRMAQIWAEESVAFLAEVEGDSESPMIIASSPSGPGIPIGVPTGRAVASGAFLGGLFSFLLALSAMCFLAPPTEARHG